MKRQIVFLLFFSLTVLFVQGGVSESFSQTNKARIVLVNPTGGGFKSFIQMLDKKIIKIKNPEITAVFYSKSRYRPDPVNIVIEEQDIKYAKTRTVDGSLNAENLFQKNSCTDEFLDIFKNSDGIVFFGGADFPPVIYKQKTNLLTNISTPHRHYFELSFLFHLTGGSWNEKHTPYLEEKPDYVIFGFCLGMQSINVAAGGSMYQDIPSEIYGLNYVEDVLKLDKNAHHKNYWRSIRRGKNLMGINFHKIRFENTALFADRLKISGRKTPSIYSSHHQAVKDIGKGFKITARSMDGRVVEAIAHSKYRNVIGVQFHPEVLSLYEPNLKKYKYSPDDKKEKSYYEIINEDSGYEFNTKFWDFFSSLF